jgi:hypothetical protein
VKEFGLAGLLVGENTNTVSIGVLLVTDCKVIQDFFKERSIVMPENFVFPTNEERIATAQGKDAALRMLIIYKKLEWYWGVKNPSFVWLAYVTQLNVTMLETEVDALHKTFRSNRVPSYKESKNNKLPFMRRYALQSNRYFIATSPRRLNEWPESFFEAFLRETGGAWSGRRPTIKEKAETIEKGLEKLWPEFWITKSPRLG